MKRSELRTLVNYNNPAAADKGVMRILASEGVDVSNINKTIADQVFFFKAVITGFSTVTFFPSTGASYTAGISNLANNVRPQGEHAIIWAIRWLQGAAAAINASPWVPGTTTAEVLNGKFVITINGVKAGPENPMTVFSSSGSPDAPGLIELEHPIVWKGQEGLQIVCTWDVALATANLNGMFELWCSALTS